MFDSYQNCDNNDFNNWIYIGADIYDFNFSKVGKTTKGLDTRHTSTHRPGYFIYTAFNILNRNFCNCDVHLIEKDLLNYLVNEASLRRIPHASTGSSSECFFENPDFITGLVESYIERNYGSCVTYENQLHGWMSRYQCDEHTIRRFKNPKNSNYYGSPPPAFNLKKDDYFTGNQEEYTTNLGDGYYLDHSSGLIKHIDDD